MYKKHTIIWFVKTSIINAVIFTISFAIITVWIRFVWTTRSKIFKTISANSSIMRFFITIISAIGKETPGWVISTIYCKKKYVEIKTIPSLNTQSCIKGLLVVRDFCFWAVWAARPVQKNKLEHVQAIKREQVSQNSKLKKKPISHENTKKTP